MKLPIYFDYSATTPVDKRVAEKMMQYMTTDGFTVTLRRDRTNLAGKLKKQLILRVTKLQSY